MSCLKCMKYTMCVVNFIFFICGATVFGFGIYLSTTAKYVSLLPSLPVMNMASALFTVGIFITCVSFLGFLGALKENRCLLITFFVLLFLLMLAELTVACLLFFYEKDIDDIIKKELAISLNESVTQRQKNLTLEWDTLQKTFKCCGVDSAADWKNNLPASCCPSETPCQNTTWTGCYKNLKDVLDSNLLSTGIGIISICIIEVLSMCFSMTLFCHISKSGLGYK